MYSLVSSRSQRYPWDKSLNPSDKYCQNLLSFPVDSDLSYGQCCPPFEKLGSVINQKIPFRQPKQKIPDKKTCMNVYNKRPYMMMMMMMIIIIIIIITYLSGRLPLCLACTRLNSRGLSKENGLLLYRNIKWTRLLWIRPQVSQVCVLQLRTVPTN